MLLNEDIIPGSNLEVYHLPEIAIAQKPPGDDCLVTLYLPDEYLTKVQVFRALLDCSTGFPKDCVYSIASVELWNKKYTQDCLNGKYDLLYVLQNL